MEKDKLLLSARDKYKRVMLSEQSDAEKYAFGRDLTHELALHFAGKPSNVAGLLS